MKNLAFILVAAFTIIACNNDPRLKMPKDGIFGAAFKVDQTVTVEQVISGLDTANNIPVKVTGTISQYCKGEGCWLTLKNNDGEDLFVEVKDKAFVLPHNIENKIATAHGIAIKDTADGKPRVSVVADGIIIEK